MNADSARPRKASNVTGPFPILWVGSGDETNVGMPQVISHVKTASNSAKTARMALETHQNTPEVHMYLHIGPKGPYVP